jgi:hypothetical protein
MSYQHFYKDLSANAVRLFPSLKDRPAVDWDHLISPLEMRLPKRVLENARAAIEAFWRVSRSNDYRLLLDDVGGASHARAPNHSVLMAYDFHTTPEGDCALVEINTNASGFMLTSLLELTHEPRETSHYPPLQSLAESFRNELRLTGRDDAAPAVAICDEDLVNQKMYAEFLMYRDWFETLDWRASLCDSRDFKLGPRLQTADGTDVDLVYNRATDFYLEDPAHAALRTAYDEGLACVSPNPREYWLLADKQRLVQMSEPDFLERVGVRPADREAIERVLIPTFTPRAFGSPDEIWAQRRTLFFKPRQSFGGKSVYRGESVSRKVFERLMNEDVLIQKFVPAQRVPVDDERSVLANWKFDLRFYVYEDQIQSVVARVYQGQVTNFSSAMGGFTRVQF